MAVYGFHIPKDTNASR